MEAWGLTDPGMVREQNQDSYDIVQMDDGALLCIVCDGMGGAKSGNVASRLACEVFVNEIQRIYRHGSGEEASGRHCWLRQVWPIPRCLSSPSWGRISMEWVRLW